MKIRVVKDNSIPEPVPGQWAIEETVWDAILDMQHNHPGSSIAVYAGGDGSNFIDILFVGPSNTYDEAPDHYPNNKDLKLYGLLNTESREVER